jgi:hypothetical protein
LWIQRLPDFGEFLIKCHSKGAQATEKSPAFSLQPASASSIVYAMNEPVTVQNWLAVGTAKNKGKLYVKGYLQNPNKNKALRVKDNMKIKGSLTVSGNITISGSSKLLGIGIIGGQTLGEGVVTTEKLANSAVTSEKIYDGMITTAKLADNSITSAKIQNGTVAAEDLASNSVTSAKIVDGTITGSDIASGTVTGSNIASGTITSSNIDFTTNGVVKAGVYVNSPSSISSSATQITSISGSYYFNNLSGGSVPTVARSAVGKYTLDFGTSITSNYFQVIAYDTARLISTINSVSGNTLTVWFYDPVAVGYGDPSSGFYVLVF